MVGYNGSAKGKGNLAGEEDPEECNIFNDR